MIRNNFEDYQKQYYLKKDWIVPYSQFPQGSKIVLYGAGDVGQAYYMQIKYTGYCKVVAWVDQDAELYKSWEMNVDEVSAINNCEYDYVLLAIADSKTAKIINDLLLEMNVVQEKIVWIGFERETIKEHTKKHYLLDALKEEADHCCQINGVVKNSSAYHEYYSNVLKDIEDDNKIVIPRLVVQLTQKCTLKCRGCNNLMPLYSKAEHFEIQDIVNNVNNLLNKVDRIIVMELLGGEPFLYPDLDKVINQVGQISQIDVIEITTNGTLLPSVEILNLLKKYNVLVRISKYKKSIRLNELIDSLKEQGIRYEVLDELVWTDSSNTKMRQMNSFEELITNYKCKSPKYCKTLSNGKMFLCARAASLYDLGICNDTSNYIDIISCNKKALKKFIEFPHGSACNYCTCMDDWREIEVGEQ